jgi:hypothetical protein
MSRDQTAEAPFKAGEILEVRRMVAGKTVTYSVRVEQGWIGPANGAMHFRGQVKASGWSPGTDAALDRQRASINRLLSHVKVHCPVFQIPSADCEFPSSDEAEGVQS